MTGPVFVDTNVLLYSFDDLSAWDPIAIDHEVVRGAYRIQDRFGFSFWDALIVSAAERSGCRLLLSEDLQAGQAIGTLRVVNPFTEPPPA